MAGIKKQIKRWYSAVPNNKPMFETPAIIATGRKRDFKLSSQEERPQFSHDWESRTRKTETSFE